MSYKALYRTYRPKNFDQVVGQAHIVKTLQNMIKQNKIGHAYLFAGPRGTGKTTLAQIFAQEINKSATKLDQDFSFDIIEIDAASNNGVTEIRTLIENSKFAPSEAFYKVYIIDEVHMLTKGAWNALLKTLEEPPSHIVFILATTEAHKIPITILSRIQRFNFKRIDNQVIYQQLIKIFNQEKISYDQESLKFIAKLASGGLRDALSISDQAAAFGNGKISFEAISQVFGLVSINKQIEVLNLAFKGETKKLIKALHDFSENGADLERLTISLIDVLRDFIVFKKTNDVSLINYLSTQDIDTIVLDINFAYQIIDELIDLAQEIKFTELPRHLFELTILKITNLNDHTYPNNNYTNNYTNNYENNPSLNANASTIVFDQLKADKKHQLYNQDLHDLKLLYNSQGEPLTQNDIFHTTLIDLKIVSHKDDSSLTTTEKLIDPDYAKQLKDLSVSEPNNNQNIDVIKLFGLDQKTPPLISENEQLENNKTYKMQELINLLMLANKQELTEVKDRFNILTAYINSQEYGKYANLLSSIKIICAGKNFLMVSSTQNEVVEQLNLIRENQDFLKFTELILGKPVWVFSITKEQFEEVKKTWNIMKAENNLPKSNELTPILLEKNLSETEAFGREIFGELFDK